jgi:flagellar protein FlaG
MAIEGISSTSAYQTMATVQAPQPVTRPAAEVTTDGETMQDISVRPDPTTSIVEAAHEAAEDGEQSGGQSSEYTQKDSEKLKKAVEDMNKKMNNSIAKYGIHEGTNRVTIKIVDKDTDKVIKELPPDKTLDMIAKVWEMAGILVDEKR